jgi:hypothetical protein
MKWYERLFKSLKSLDFDYLMPLNPFEEFGQMTRNYGGDNWIISSDRIKKTPKHVEYEYERKPDEFYDLIKEGLYEYALMELNDAKIKESDFAKEAGILNMEDFKKRLDELFEKKTQFKKIHDEIEEIQKSLH